MEVASLQRRGDGRIEIRESVTTPRGPRSRTLAVFRGSLTPDVLERAAARARRPLDPAALRARAGELGIPVTARREDRAAREFLEVLRQGRPVDPALIALIRQALARLPTVVSVPEALAEVAEWLGSSPAQRGEALRGLLRVSDRITRSRALPRERHTRRFPRFASRATADAA